MNTLMKGIGVATIMSGTMALNSFVIKNSNITDIQQDSKNIRVNKKEYNPISTNSTLWLTLTLTGLGILGYSSIDKKQIKNDETKINRDKDC